LLAVCPRLIQDHVHVDECRIDLFGDGLPVLSNLPLVDVNQLGLEIHCMGKSSGAEQGGNQKPCFHRMFVETILLHLSIY
jgi:hypothetical protein